LSNLNVHSKDNEVLLVLVQYLQCLAGGSFGCNLLLSVCFNSVKLTSDERHNLETRDVEAKVGSGSGGSGYIFVEAEAEAL